MHYISFKFLLYVIFYVAKFYNNYKLYKYIDFYNAFIFLL